MEESSFLPWKAPFSTMAESVFFQLTGFHGSALSFNHLERTSRKEFRVMKLTVRRQRSGITIRLEIGDVILTVELPKQNAQTAL
jgi:hypothetical protein